MAEPILKDTLDKWNPVKGFSCEVVNLLWVLKKKYLDGKFKRCKGRICYDGRMQKDKFEKRTGSVLDTFAPTARHTTQKLVCARGVSEGGSRTCLSSRAHIEKLVADLPRPLAS